MKLTFVCLVFGLGLVRPGVAAQQVEYVITGTRIVQFDSSGDFLLQFGGTGTSNGLFQLPSGIAVDGNNGHVWVSDAILNRVQEFDFNGNFITQFGSTGTAPGQLLGPYGLAIDSASNVWVADTGNNRIQEFTSTGGFVQSFGTLGGGNGQFNAPVGVAIGGCPPDGNACVGTLLLVSDTGNYRIQEFTLNGSAPPVFFLNFGRYGNGGGTFAGPFEINFCLGGTCAVVADPYNQVIQEFLPAFGDAAPVGTIGSFFYKFTYPSPYGVAADPNSVIWAVDYNGNKVVSIGPTDTSFGVTGGGPGQLFHPTYIAIGLKSAAP